VPSLKGIHYAMQSGMFAARAIFDALKAGDSGAARLAAYDRALAGSYVMADLKKTGTCGWRSSRVLRRGMKAGLMTVTGGRLFGGRIAARETAEPRDVEPAEPFVPDNTLTFSKVTRCSSRATRPATPFRCTCWSAKTLPGTSPSSTATCVPRGYERVVTSSGSTPPTAWTAKATDVLGPRWDPARRRQRAEIRSM
jgi:electron-transferring-flavoprotein dehydrogenase